MCLQEFKIYLNNGHVIKTVEEVNIPTEQRLHNRFKKAGQDDILTVGSEETSRAFIPVRNILYISTGDVIGG